MSSNPPTRPAPSKDHTQLLQARLQQPAALPSRSDVLNVTVPAKKAQILAAQQAAQQSQQPRLNPLPIYAPQKQPEVHHEIPPSLQEVSAHRPRSGQVEPLPLSSTRAVLPDLPDLQLNRNKPLPDVRRSSAPVDSLILDPTDEAIRQLRGASMPEIVKYIRLNGQRVGFLYLARNGDKSSSDYHSYNLRVSPHEKIDQSDFFTLSDKGMTHVHNGHSEFTPLDVWEKEYGDFHRLRQFRSFKQFRMWKAFAVWRKNLVTSRMIDRSAKLQDSLFIVNNEMRAALIEARALCINLTSTNLCSINRTLTYTLVEFIEAQHQKVHSSIARLVEFRTSIKDLVLRACSQSLIQSGFDDDEPASGNQDRSMSMSDAEAPVMTYTEQAAKRAHCFRISHFIRLIDYLVANTLQSLAVDSTAALQQHIDHIMTAADELERKAQLEAEEDAKKAAEIEAAKQAAKGDKHGSHPAHDPEASAPATVYARKHRKHAFNPHDEGDFVPMFKIEFKLDNQQFAFEPNMDAFTSSLQNIVQTFQDSVAEVDGLLFDDAFNPFTRPTINKRAEILIGSEPFSLASILEDDTKLHSIIDSVVHQVEAMFTKCNNYASSLEKFREMVAENAALDVEWVRNTDHAPSFFADSLAKYKDMYAQACSLDTAAEVGAMLIDCNTLKNEVMPSPLRCLEVIQEVLPKNAALKNKESLAKIDDAVYKLEFEPSTTLEYVNSINFISGIEQTMIGIEEQVKTVTELFELVDRFEIQVNPEELANYQTLRNAIVRLRDAVKKRVEERDKLINRFCDELDKDISNLGTEVLTLRNDAQSDIIFNPNADLEQVLAFMDKLTERVTSLIDRSSQFKAYQKSFGVEITKFTALEETAAEIRSKKLVWESVRDWSKLSVQWSTMPFETIDADDMSSQVNRMIKQVYTLQKSLPPNEVIPGLQVKIEKMKDHLPLITDLRNPSLKSRHWEKIDQVVGQTLPHDETFTITLLDELEIWKHKEAMQEISSGASSEAALEVMLKKVEDAWKKMEMPVLPNRDSKDVFILGAIDVVQALLDDSQVNIATIAGSRHVGPIKPRIDEWQRQLNLFSETLEEWLNCQRSWLYLESIFGAPDIQRQLPDEAKKFLEVDKSFKDAMRKTVRAILHNTTDTHHLVGCVSQCNSCRLYPWIPRNVSEKQQIA